MHGMNNLKCHYTSVQDPMVIYVLPFYTLRAPILLLLVFVVIIIIIIIHYELGLDNCFGIV
jgi:hypothetical protein